MGHIKIETVLIEVCHTLKMISSQTCQVVHAQIQFNMQDHFLCPPPPPQIYKVQGILKCGSLHTTMY